MIEIEYKHTCEWCEKEFVSQRKNQKFCNSHCAVSSQTRNRHLKRIQENAKENKEIANRKLENKCVAENKYIYCINGVYAQSLGDYDYHKDSICTCVVCGKKFILRDIDSVYKNSGQYCSEKCMFEGSKEKVIAKCKNCGKNFEMNKHDSNYRIFCSDTCESNFYENIDKKNLTQHEKLKCTCINCEKTFYPIEPTKSITFCSYDCKMEFQEKKSLKEYVCMNCGKKFMFGHKRKFCSRKCSSSYTAKQIGFGTTIREHKNGLKGRKQTEHAKKLISKNISKAIRSEKMNPAGNYLCGFVSFIPHNFRSGWEFNFAVILLHLNRDYRYEAKTFKLDEKRYTPDFYDVKRNLFYEIKGREKGEQSYLLLKQKYPNIKIHFINYRKYLRIYNHFAKKLKLVQSVAGGNKSFYSSNDIREMLISKEEHDRLFSTNIYKEWDKSFDKKF